LVGIKRLSGMNFTVTTFDEIVPEIVYKIIMDIRKSIFNLLQHA